MSFDQHLQELYEQSQLCQKLSYPELREKSWQKFLSVGLPQRNEDWKYTNLGSLKDLAPTSLVLEESVLEEKIQSCTILPYRLVFIDGKYDSRWSILPATGCSLTIQAVDKLIDTDCIGSLIGSGAQDFTALNSALFLDAMILRFGRSSDLSQGIQVIHIATQSFSAPRFFYHVESEAKVTIWESYHALSDCLALSCPVSEYQLESAAELAVYKTTNSRSDHFHVSTQQAHLQRDSRFSAYTFNLNIGITRNNLAARLCGEGAYASMVALNLLSDQEHVDNNTVLDHVAPHCDSFELYKSVLSGQSRSVFNGTIVVQQDAQKTNAIQSNQSLLLSDQAQSFAKPQLKIWADDVKCTHGATSGNIDEQALFYLRSRGIAETDARKMLVTAFVSEIIDHSNFSIFNAWIRQELDQKLATIF